LDEPFAALDEGGITLLTQRFKRHLDEGGMAIVATHQEVGLSRESLRYLRLPG
jgi:heme exporter protein A